MQSLHLCSKLIGPYRNSAHLINYKITIAPAQKEAEEIFVYF